LQFLKNHPKSEHFRYPIIWRFFDFFSTFSLSSQSPEKSKSYFCLLIPFVLVLGPLLFSFPFFLEVSQKTGSLTLLLEGLR
jgi:hypothetical protein